MTDKKSLRASMIAVRDAIDPASRLSFSRSIAERVAAHPAFAPAKTVGLFASIGSELDTAFLHAACRAAGKDVAYPRVDGAVLAFHLANARADLLPAGRMRIPEPAVSSPRAAPDLFVVPGLAFDARRFRVGYGAGFYDRLLAESGAVRIGVAFDAQIVAELPDDSWDVPMDAVVTEARIL